MTDITAHIENLIQTAIDLGYLRSHGENKYTITPAGQKIILEELTRPVNFGLTLEILNMGYGDKQGSAHVGVLLKVIERGTA